MSTTTTSTTVFIQVTQWAYPGEPDKIVIFADAEGDFVDPESVTWGPLDGDLTGTVERLMSDDLGYALTGTLTVTESPQLAHSALPNPGSNSVLIGAWIGTSTVSTVRIPSDATVLPMGDMTTCPVCGDWALYTRPNGMVGCAVCGETTVSS